MSPKRLDSLLGNRGKEPAHSYVAEGVSFLNCVMHRLDAPAMFQSVLSVSIRFIRDAKRATRYLPRTTSSTTNPRLRDKAKLKTLLVMLAYRTDKHMSRVGPCLLDIWCEDTVKMDSSSYKALLSARVRMAGVPTLAPSTRAALPLRTAIPTKPELSAKIKGRLPSSP